MRPLLTALVTIALAAAAASLAGLSFYLVAAITVAVAVLGGIVAHRTVGGLIAGIGLLVIRPYSAGERLRITSPIDCTMIEVEVIRLGIVNTTLATPDGMLVVPNTRLIRGLPPIPEPGRDPARSGCR
jgi:small-conductance mechanosensitive channel